MDDLKGKTIRGGLAKVISQAVNFVFRVGSLMVLARLLDPRDFGLVGMVTVVTGVFSLFKDAGLSMVTIQRPNITDQEVSALFWINMLVGTVLAALSLAMAPILAAFYAEPRLFWVTAAMASGFILNALGVQHSAILQRKMLFPALSLIEIISQLVSTAVGIGMAIRGYGYWSLVAMALLLPMINSFGSWLMAGWMPGRPRRQIGTLSMIRFGGAVTVNGLIVYIAYNLDKVLLGRFWGAGALGIYGRAYQLVNIPTDNLNSAVGGVAFSALSRVQEDPDRFKSYFLKGYSLVLGLTLPITITCALFAEDLILVLLGAKWTEAILIFRLLSPTIQVFGMINPLSWFLFSAGLVGRSLKIALALSPLVIIAYFIGLPYGPVGVALAYSLTMILWVVPHMAWCVYGTMISLKDLLRAIIQPFLSGIVGGIIALIVHLTIGNYLSPILRLVLDGGVLFGIYFGMLFYVMGQKSFYLDLLRGLKKQSSGQEEGTYPA